MNCSVVLAGAVDEHLDFVDRNGRVMTTRGRPPVLTMSESCEIKDIYQQDICSN